MKDYKNAEFQQCGKTISYEEIQQIQETVKMFSRLSLHELAATICEHLDWFSATGTPKVDACMKLLEKLESSEYIKLPKKLEVKKHKASTIDSDLNLDMQPQSAISNLINDFGMIEVKAVKDKEDEKLVNGYIQKYHYLGYKKPFGCFIRYLIKFQDMVLGCLMFSGAAKSMSVRDKWIGWNEVQRLRNLGWVINNNRFLILQTVQVKNLASYVLGKIGRQIVSDWYEHWGYEPVLMETFVNPKYYQGTSYKAANWQYLGMTTGEGLARKGKTYITSPKQIYVKPLKPKFKEILCSNDLVGRLEI